MVNISKSLILVIISMLLLPMVSALDNVAQQNVAYDIRVTAAANGTIDSVVANITINDPDGVVLVGFTDMTKNLDSQDFNYTLPASNTSKLGFYDCTVYAFSTVAQNKVFSCSFEVNPSGKEYIPEISGPLMFGAILTMMFLSTFLLVTGWRIDLFPMKVFLIILAGVIAILNLGFVAGSFQEFYSVQSSLSGAFGTIYIAFIIMLTGASVFLMIWAFLVGFKVYKIKRGFFVDGE